MKHLAILGSTGSVGVQTLEIIRKHSQKYKIAALGSNTNIELLAEQAHEFSPAFLILSDPIHKNRLKQLIPPGCQILTGPEGYSQVFHKTAIDLVVNAIHGYAGLLPSIKTLEAGRNLALANKETLVIAGELVLQLAKTNSAKIIPIDSEHSALMQCLSNESTSSIEKIYLTASGGPFRNKTTEDLQNVSLEETLNHPVWKMGKRITVDSASMMNKGFEMIEARWLFALQPDQIDILVHPESIVHSMIQFRDGSIKAQLSTPDMQIPILYALSYPEREETQAKRLGIADFNRLSFYPTDDQKFPNLRLAKEALERGGNLPCLLNAANEEVVNAFLNQKISFNKMPQVNETILRSCRFIEHPDYQDLIESDREARLHARNILLKK